MAMKTEEEILLNDAAEIIEKRGWRQGVANDSERLAGGVCAAEAVGLATRVRYGLGTRRPEGLRAMNEIKARTGWNGVAAWNDEPGRTEAEVLEVLRGQTSL